MVDTVTGTDVTAAPSGDQGINGTFYVNILTSGGFDYVVATSSQYAFEFDNVAYSQRVPHVGQVPLPASIWLFGSVVAGSGLLFRRRRKRDAAAAA